MRNDWEYPPVTSEIIEMLERLREHEQRRIEEVGLIGNMTCVLLDEAIDRIRHGTTFSLRRMDDNGNVVVVREGMSKKHAFRLYDLLTKRGHKQVYHVVIETRAPETPHD